MPHSSLAVLALVTGYTSVVDGQATWAEKQINSSICYWEQPRAAVIRDTIYIDGGRIWWRPGFANGTYGSVESDDNPLGLVYTLNFSTPFNVTGNMTSIMRTLPRVDGAANNLTPNFYDGAMLANDNGFFLYGGLLRQTDASSDPADDQVLAYQRLQYGTEKEGFQPGFVYDQLPDGMTRYLAYGGAANAPSENKSWYFSGMHSPTWGPIYEPSGNASRTASNLSDTFITLNLSTHSQERWKNESLPRDIKGRAGAELVWVPVGEQGILVSLGGVTYPEYMDNTGESPDAEKLEKDGDDFMTNIDVYDVASNRWYTQPTVGGPSALTRGCAVVAPSLDGSSYNLYYYGGYSGASRSEVFHDDVWILSLPSFMWMKAASGTGPGRAGHRCFMPYPDTMLVVGGYTNNSQTCLQGGVVRVFNLTSGEWLRGYDPTKWSAYGIPPMIYIMIGGTAQGSATMTIPTPSGWATSDMSKVFETAYPTTKIATYYPYATSGGDAGGGGSGGGGGGGVPSYLPPVLGVVLGVIFLTIISVLILLWRRRTTFKASHADGLTGTANDRRSLFWNHPRNTQALHATTDDSAQGAGRESDMESVRMLSKPAPSFEMTDTQVSSPLELWDAAPQIELDKTGTGISHVDVINNHTGLAAARRSGFANSVNPSYYSAITQQTDTGSIMSRSSGTQSPQTTRPPPGSSGRDAMSSSAASVSSRAMSPNHGSPSPSAVTFDGLGDFGVGKQRPMSSGGATSSPLRRSVFIESQEDMTLPREDYR